MSSIDKGVENLVSGMGKNIRVSKEGKTGGRKPQTSRGDGARGTEKARGGT